MKQKIDLCGTVSKSLRSSYGDSKKKAEGESIAYERDKVMLMKWKEKKVICLLSTVTQHRNAPNKKRDRDGNIITKPKVVIDYDTMGGVDLLAQHLYDYPTTRKRGKILQKDFFFIFWIFPYGLHLFCIRKMEDKK